MKHRGSTYLLKDFKGDRTLFKEIDNLVFDARCADEKPIEDCSEAENTTKVAEVILRAGSIYGFKPFPTEMYLDDVSLAVVDYLLKFGFGGLLWSEINLALMINSKPNIKYPSGEDYEAPISKSSYFNLQYLAKVLDNYMIFRNNLDEIIRKMFDGIKPYTNKF